jgi:hypothetical protein
MWSDDSAFHQGPVGRNRLWRWGLSLAGGIVHDLHKGLEAAEHSVSVLTGILRSLHGCPIVVEAQGASCTPVT